MNAAEALRTVRLLAADGENVDFSEHAANDSILDDGLFKGDVVHVLASAVEAVPEDAVGLKFKIYGPLPLGEDYAVIVNVHADYLFVITCHFPP